MHPYLAEFIGTGLLILLGNGVVANVVLKDTKGHNSGWIVITFGWAIGVFVGVFTVAAYSGAHINPAVTLGLALTGQFEWGLVPGYMLSQIFGAGAGAFLVWVAYRKHYQASESGAGIRATFCTDPAIRSYFDNFNTEVIGTFVLVFCVLYLAQPDVGLGALDALPVALLVLGLGLSLGGPTGYAINPARDLGPRLVHWMLPFKQKAPQDWAYAWIPIVGPVVGSTLAALLYYFLN